jgi:hypothetical protein
MCKPALDASIKLTTTKNNVAYKATTKTTAKNLVDDFIIKDCKG